MQTHLTPEGTRTLTSSTEDLFPVDHWEILMVDDDKEDVLVVEDLLRSGHLHNLRVDWCPNPNEAMQALCQKSYSVCLVDFRLGPETGLDFVSRARQAVPHVPMIVLTGDGSRDIDIAAMNAGAVDFLNKDKLDGQILERCIRYAVENARRRVVLERMARRDPLTGLHNRASIEERISDACQRSLRNKRAMAVMLVDLDGFKAVNDTLGHAAGDQLLKVVSERLKRALRGYDAVGRLGGDEFVAIVEDLASCEEAAEVADRLVGVISPPFELTKTCPAVTASIGYVCFPSEVDSPDRLLETADRAMYSAKRAGKARARRYSTGSREPKMVSGDCLRAAIARGELRLAMQPQLDLTSGDVAGIEALVRWKPRQSEILPGSFIPPLEQSGAVAELDLWVFSEALAIHSRLAPASRISINISGVDLEDPGFAARLVQLLPPNLECELELTETASLFDRSDLLYRLSALRDHGFRLALDDFGIGHSSLAQLSRLQVDTLKIDRSFVQNIATRRTHQAIVSSVVSLASHLDIQVVAEGIESAEQAEQLAELGVTCGQGFWLAPPMEEAQLAGWLESGKGNPRLQSQP